MSCSHATIRFYGCHFCSRIFCSPKLLSKHASNCQEFEQYQAEKTKEEEKVSSNFEIHKFLDGI